MDTDFLLLLLLAFVVLLINIPFGYWRKKERKLSVKWFLAIHIPVVISIAFRYCLGIASHWTHLLLFVFAFFVGQSIGQWIFVKRKALQKNTCTKY